MHELETKFMEARKKYLRETNQISVMDYINGLHGACSVEIINDSVTNPSAISVQSAICIGFVEQENGKFKLTFKVSNLWTKAGR